MSEEPYGKRSRVIGRRLYIHAASKKTKREANAMAKRLRKNRNYGLAAVTKSKKGYDVWKGKK